MASIVKRKNKFAVVYTCEDDKGAKKQRWETFDTNAEAKKRKTEIGIVKKSAVGKHTKFEAR